MKFKHLLAGLTALTLAASVQAALLDENFDSVSTLAGKGWVQKNNSGAPSLSWFQGTPGSSFDAQSGAADSYIAASFNSTSGVTPATNTVDNWLLTPYLALTSGETVSFYTRSTGALPDHLEVRLSSNGASTNTSDFSTLLFDLNPALDADGYPTDWFNVTFTIPTIVGLNGGRLGFRYFVTDSGPAGNNGDYIGIDTVAVPEPTTVMTLGIGMLALLAMRRRNSVAQK
ncbi:MAG: choice-of-anchor J domain-containing protein [Pseudomonadota bacterium]